MIENGHLVKAKNVLIKEFSQEEAVKMNVKRYCLLAQLSNRVVSNAADLIYAALYEWTGQK